MVRQCPTVSSLAPLEGPMIQAQCRQEVSELAEHSLSSEGSSVSVKPQLSLSPASCLLLCRHQQILQSAESLPEHTALFG